MVIGAIIFAYIIRSISTLARNPNLSQVLNAYFETSLSSFCFLSSNKKVKILEIFFQERQTNKLVPLSSYLEEKKVSI